MSYSPITIALQESNLPRVSRFTLHSSASEAVREIKESIVPWRKQHAEELARLAETEKAARIESIKAEILERRARAQKDRAEAERLSAEAAKQREEVRRLRLENERTCLELHREKVQLALDILDRIAPNLAEVDRAAYLVKLLPPVEILTSSELEVLTD